jgi:mRNA-degrading endonuclease toxin of MazEF toxin-antitoxin module
LFAVFAARNQIPQEELVAQRSVLVASQVSTVDKADLGDYIGSLDERRVSQILAGMRFLQWFTGRGGEEQAAE